MQSICGSFVFNNTMNFILNILWAVFGGGIILAVEYALAGIVCCLTIVGIPFGLQCFKVAGLALFPFGKDFTVEKSNGIGGTLFNLIWIVFAGIWIFLSQLTIAIGLAVTIIGIPFAFQHLKLAMLAFAPFGARIRES
jgi:uncharacterized membrane protein YccF (DUF307 family)